MRNIVFLLILISQVTFAQKKQMSLKDAVYGKYTYLAPKKMNNVLWKNEDSFSYLDKSVLWVETVNKGDKEKVLHLDEIQKVISRQLRSFPAYSWLSDNQILLQTRDAFYVLDLPEKKVLYSIDLPEGAANPEFSAAGKFVSFTLKNDLYFVIPGGKVTQLTFDGGNGIVNGQTVHRNEFGITKGIFNSPLGNFIAFYRKDESMVTAYPLVDFMTREASPMPVKYPMAGMKSHHVQLGVYDIRTGKTLFMKTGEPKDHYLTNVAWSPDEEKIYMAELNREQNHMLLNCYFSATGEMEKNLFEEFSDKYVEPLHAIQFSKTDPNNFYYLNRKDGWFHICKYNTDGELMKQITEGDWEVNTILGFDNKEKNVFVEGTFAGPLEKHIYKIEVKTGKMTQLTSRSGIHSGKLSPDANYLIDNWNASDIPDNSDLLSADGKILRNLHTAEDPLENYDLGENTLVTLQTADGKTDLHGRIIKPVDFDPQKKYPVVLYVYGGPHSQLVNKSWNNNARWWQYYMASKGFIAFTLDNRGTANRGRDFETAIHRQLGVLETEDQIQGINYLKSLPYVDENRIGVHGWSYGGFMTLNLMLHHPETFKVGVAGGPVVDWELYEIMYGERYMDKPQENPEGYKKTNMANFVSDLNGKLMLIHGVQDKTVVMQHSMKFIRECIRQEKQIDFFAYPTHPHNVRGFDRVHLMEKVSNYFIENL